MRAVLVLLLALPGAFAAVPPIAFTFKAGNAGGVNGERILAAKIRGF
jgi:hypothetical protein